MRLPTKRAMVLALALAAACTPPVARAQEPDNADSDRIALQWLAEAPRHDIRASVEFSPARLNFEQRLALVGRIEIPARELQAASVHRDLYLVVKASDGTRWQPNGSYTHYEITRELGKHDAIEFVCTMFVRPGRWIFGVVLYDALTRQRTVIRKTVNVPSLKHDPMPRLDTGLPPVEFLKAEQEPLPSTPAAAYAANRYPGNAPRGPELGPGRGMGRRRQSPVESEPERQAAPGVANTVVMATEPSPPVELNLKRPVIIDVLVDFTPSEQYSGSTRILRRTESTFWSVTHVLTRLHAPNLCMRVTGVDVIGQRVLFADMDAADMDWIRIAAELDKLDANTVQVQTLESRTKSADFFRNAVDDMLTKHSDCPAAAEHVYIIAASGILFPSGTASRPIEGSPAPLYYLRANLLWNDQWDAMAKIVKPLHPRVIAIDDAMKFRKALGQIVADLEGASK